MEIRRPVQWTAEAETIMQPLSKLDRFLERTAATNRWRRVFSARIDMTLKRGRRTSAWVARSLGVSEGVVGLWRAGIMVPNGDQCTRLSKLLRVDLQWLCAIEDPVSF